MEIKLNFSKCDKATFACIQAFTICKAKTLFIFTWEHYSYIFISIFIYTSWLFFTSEHHYLCMSIA